MSTMYLDHDPTRLLIKRQQLNPICEDCILFGTNCNGTTCQSWTGCTRKPWNPAPEIDLLGVKSRHGINPEGLAQAVTLSHNATADLHIVIYYSETADAIKAQIRRPGEPLRTPSTFQFVSIAARELTAAEIIADIDTHIDLLTELPF